MGEINVLDFEVANLIAAGEVVDRPASVIKELLENSIDSGATIITVETKNGGISYMRVTDNGRGMNREDVPVCIKRHATSKINKATDLDGIVTLGFRGEALTAIAAVSKMRILTKSRASSIGTLMQCDAGVITEMNDAGGPDGTTVIVEELFRNVPARRKFLKRNMTETMAAANIVEKIALSRPDISVKLICDGVMRFNTSGDGNPQSTIYAIMGKEFAKKLINAQYLTEGIEIAGFIGSPDNTHGNRNLQNFILNGRYIKSKILMSALEQAFSSFISSDRFPSCVLYITIHPAYVDVNVHPAKIEVKFSDDKAVFNVVYSAVKNALTQGMQRPSMNLPNSPNKHEISKIVNAFVPIKEPVSRKGDEPPSRIIDLFADYPDNGTDNDKTIETLADTNTYAGDINVEPHATNKDYAFRNVTTKTNTTKDLKIQQSSDEIYNGYPNIAGNSLKVSENAIVYSAVPRYRIIGEAFNSYVFIELEGSIMIIDKHAAHERILFEEMRANYIERNVYSQMLLLPMEITLSGNEYAALIEYRSDVEKTGFTFSGDDNLHSLKLLQIPVGIDIDMANAMITAIAGQLAEGRGNPSLTREIAYEKALYQGACKAAVKAGERNDNEHLSWICDRLLILPDIKYCPHGRPVAFELTKRDIERQFKRT